MTANVLEFTIIRFVRPGQTGGTLTFGADPQRPAPAADRFSPPMALPAALSAALLPFQREGVAYALSRHGRCLIADDMGLGKSLQGLVRVWVPAMFYSPVTR